MQRKVSVMSLFTIGDTHLSLSCDKPMDIFRGWQDYVTRLEKNWRRVVEDTDIVVIPGDISWAMKLKETQKDFAFLHSLPGQKIIAKGNHDLWWETMKKMNAFLDENGFDSLHILHNNHYETETLALCGSRGWIMGEGEDDRKVLLREVGRLEMSLQSAVNSGKEPVVFLHYPPVTTDRRCEEIIDLLHRYGVKRCFYGHLHGPALATAVNGEVDGIVYRVVSGDALEFCPLLVEKY